MSWFRSLHDHLTIALFVRDVLAARSRHNFSHNWKSKLHTCKVSESYSHHGIYHCHNRRSVPGTRVVEVQHALHCAWLHSPHDCLKQLVHTHETFQPSCFVVDYKVQNQGIAGTQDFFYLLWGGGGVKGVIETRLGGVTSTCCGGKLHSSLSFDSFPSRNQLLRDRESQKKLTVVFLWNSGWLRPLASFTNPFATTCCVELAVFDTAVAEALRLWLGEAAGLAPCQEDKDITDGCNNDKKFIWNIWSYFLGKRRHSSSVLHKAAGIKSMACLKKHRTMECTNILFNIIGHRQDFITQSGNWYCHNETVHYDHWEGNICEGCAKKNVSVPCGKLKICPTLKHNYDDSRSKDKNNNKLLATPSKRRWMNNKQFNNRQAYFNVYKPFEAIFAAKKRIKSAVSNFSTQEENKISWVPCVKFDTISVHSTFCIFFGPRMKKEHTGKFVLFWGGGTVQEGLKNLWSFRSSLAPEKQWPLHTHINQTYLSNKCLPKRKQNRFIPFS